MVSRLDVSIFLIINLNFLNSNEDLFIYFSYYDMPVDKVQKLINAIDDNKTGFTTSPFISEKLRKLVEIPEPEKKLVDELKQTKIELQKQMKDMQNMQEKQAKVMQDMQEKQMKDMQDMKKLLNNFIGNSNTNGANDKI